MINNARSRVEAIKNEIEELRREKVLQALVDRNNIQSTILRRNNSEVNWKGADGTYGIQNLMKNTVRNYREISRLGLK